MADERKAEDLLARHNQFLLVPENHWLALYPLEVSSGGLYQSQGHAGQQAGTWYRHGTWT